MTDLQDSALISALPLVGKPIVPPEARTGASVVFADAGYGYGQMIVVLPDGRHFRGDFMLVDRGWEGSEYPAPGPGRLEATLHEGLDRMDCEMIVQDRTVLSRSGVGTCDISGGGTTSVMW